MPALQSRPKQGDRFAAGAAFLLLAAWYADPAIASSAYLCDDLATLAHEVPAGQLQVIAVSHEIDAQGSEIEAISPKEYLTPRLETALRKAFEDITTPLADSDDAVTDDAPVMNTRLPGVSDEEMARYKRQMYRVDI